MKKRILSIVLSIVMLVGLLPMNVWATETGTLPVNTVDFYLKDENGNVTADMKLMFGKIGEVNHYTGENEYVMIELEY